MGEDRVIMDQVAEDGGGFRLPKRKVNGVPHAKTKSQMGRTNYFHKVV